MLYITHVDGICPLNINQLNEKLNCYVRLGAESLCCIYILVAHT